MPSTMLPPKGSQLTGADLRALRTPITSIAVFRAMPSECPDLVSLLVVDSGVRSDASRAVW